MIAFGESAQYFWLPEMPFKKVLALQTRLIKWGAAYQYKADEIATGVSDRWDYVNMTDVTFRAYMVAAGLEPSPQTPLTFYAAGPPVPLHGDWAFLDRRFTDLATLPPLTVASAMASAIAIAQMQSIMVHEQVQKMHEFHLRGEHPNV